MQLDLDTWHALVGAPHPLPQLERFDNERGRSADLFRARWGDQKAILKISRERSRGLRELRFLRTSHTRTYGDAERERGPAPTGHPDTPRLLGGLEQEDQVLLLLEEVEGAEVGDILAGVSGSRAIEAAATVGRLHARWWGNLPAGWEDAPTRWVEMSDAQVAAFTARWPLFAGRLDRLCDPALQACLNRAPRTLIHADAHLDNWLFRPAPLLLDWECARVGPGAIDLLRLMMEGPHTAVRRAVHQEMVAAWAAELPAEAGEQAQDWLRAALWYSLSALGRHVAELDESTLSERFRRSVSHCIGQASDLLDDLSE